MSEGGGGSGPDIGPNYQNAGPATYSNPPSQPPTPSSTVQDPPSYHSVEVSENSNESKPNVTNLHSNSSASGLPPFSSFAASDVNEGLGGRLAGDGYLTSDGISSTRVMELSGWDYCYTDGLSGRYLDRGDSMPVMIPQPQYRPWESKQDGSSDSNKSTLPSFQSQFGEELVTTLTTLTPAACSPAPSVQSPSLPSFHTLSAVNPRYPLVPAPVQAREIPSIQQQFLDERHIHLFQGPPGQNFALQPQNGLNGQTLTSLNNGTTLTTLNNAQYHPQILNNAQILPSGQIITPQSHHLLAPSSQIITSNGHIISSSGGQGLTVVSQNSTPTVLTVVKTEPVNIVELKSNSSESSNLTQLHHTNFQNPLITQGQHMDSKFGLESPPRGVDGRKKERRKMRASSLESSNESDGAMSVESSGQVAAVSSTAGFKSPMTPGQMTTEGDGMITDTGEKQTKKKRKRCGECIGCQRKDNCGDCAPCRNDKSHQICKMRRCEKLTEKKHLLAYNREDGGVSSRGRGRGRGRGSRGGCRGKAARPGAHSAQVSSVVTEMNSAPGLVVGSGRDNVKIESGRVSSGSIPANPNLTPTMAVPFYAGTEVWPTSTPADPWTAQGQFIHQIDDIRYQHYPGYQTTGYQQAGFITDQTSSFQPQYANSSNGNPSTSPAQGSVTPRSSGSYTQVHTPTPSPNPSTPHVNGHRNGLNVHYIEENYVNGTSFNPDATMVPPASTTPNSRSSSGQLEGSETNNKTTNYMSGNEIPGYPLNSPQCQSSCNSSGYPGQSLQSEYGDQSANETSYQQVNANANHVNQKSPSYAQASPGTYQTYQNFSQISPEQHQKSPKPGMSPGSCHPSQKPSGMYPQNSPNSNPSPQNYQQISPGQNRNAGQYENRNPGSGNLYLEQQRHYNESYAGQSPQHFHPDFTSQNFSQSSPSNVSQDKSSVNARIKSMIMNKHQMSQGQQQQQQQQQQNRPNSNYSASNENHMMSPNREMMSPNHQGGQLVSHNSQIPSSPMQNPSQLMSPNHNQLISNNQMSSPNSKDSKGYVQQSDYGEKKQGGQMNESTNHFLAFSHHLRDGSVLQPEGGGVQNWAESLGPSCQLGIKSEYQEQQFGYDTKNQRCSRKMEKPSDSLSAMESFMKFASAEFEKTGIYSGLESEKKLSQTEFQQRLVMYDHHGLRNIPEIPDPIKNLEANFPTKRNVNSLIPCDSPFKPESFGKLRDCRRRDKPMPLFENVSASNYSVSNLCGKEGSHLSRRNSNCSGYGMEHARFNFRARNSNGNSNNNNNININNFSKMSHSMNNNYYCYSPMMKKMEFQSNREETECLAKESYLAASMHQNFPWGAGGGGTPNVKEEYPPPRMDPHCLKMEFPSAKSEEPANPLSSDVNLSGLKVEDCGDSHVGYLAMKNEYFEHGLDPGGSGRAEESATDSAFQRVSYAPGARNMEVIDLRYVKTEPVSKEKWEEYQRAMEKEREGGVSAVKKEKESYPFEGDGGPITLEKATGAWCCRLGGIETPSPEHLRDGCCQVLSYDVHHRTKFTLPEEFIPLPGKHLFALQLSQEDCVKCLQGLQTADEISPEREKADASNSNNANVVDKSADPGTPVTSQSADSPSMMDKNCKSPGPCQENGKEFQDNMERLKNNIRSDVPDCQCFPPDKYPPEPGSYYTHLGAAASLSDLRKEVESRTGESGKALRIEKICYTGKEGKTTQGCPLAKWVIRRSCLDEKFLIVVKHRQGHTCSTAWIVVCMVAWEGVPSAEADRVYTLLSHKLNRFGLPTTRRCATNEPRTCACQGLDPDTCGASFSFGCSWSMYYNGCKYARSKTVRKFRLSVRSEEQEVEERMHVLATLLSPLYNTLAPEAFHNQTMFEREASECRLGFKPGRPFSGVTACIDFCAHSHRDLHNMNNGCTVVVSLTKHRSLSKPEDEQLHVLPLYIMDETDEFGCKESQEAKYKDGSIECLKKFPCEVRVRAVPLQPCRRHGKKRKDDEVDAVIPSVKPKDIHLKNSSPILGNNNASPMHCLDIPPVLEGMDGQLQSSQVSSTVMDSPVGIYQGWNYHGISESDMYGTEGQWNKAWVGAEAQRKQNWLNSQLSSQWDYSGYVSDRDVDPDSTTTQNQICSPITNQNSMNMNVCSNLLMGNSGAMTSSLPNNPLVPTWHQHVTDGRIPNAPYEDSKLSTKKAEHVDVKRDFKNESFHPRNGKNSPNNWSDYPMTPPPTRQSPSDSSSVFRVPKGRPPSRPTLLPSSTEPDHSETFLKPFPKEKSDNHSTSLHNSTKEMVLNQDSYETGNMKQLWLNKFPGSEPSTGNAVNIPNSFNPNQSAFNPAENYHYQKSNFPNQNFSGSNYGYGVQNYNSYVFDSKQIPAGNWPGFFENRYEDRFPSYGYNQNFGNFPPIPGRWDSHRWDLYGPPPFFPLVPEAPKSEPIGEVTDFVDNEECFKDSQMGGVAIALGHGSVLFECAKHELHATTALRRPNRLQPTRISLVFYQHRNLNRAKHGWDEWEEKMRLRKLGINVTPDKTSKDLSKASSEEANAEVLKLAGLEKPLGLGEKILVRVPTYTTTTWTTLFPMRPCMVTGPYQEGGND